MFSRLRTLSGCAVVLLFLLAASLAHAQRTIRVPADAPTIQAGIDAAATGDTVLVAPGTYYEHVSFNGKAITVTSSDGAQKTIVDGGGIGAVVSFTKGETRRAVLSHLTIRNGGPASNEAYQANVFYAPIGGVFTYASQPTILENVITANSCTGIDVTGTSSTAPLIQGNTISYTKKPSTNNGSCAFVAGAGIGLWFASTQKVPIVGNVIEHNEGSSYFGGGVSVNGSFPYLERNILRFNTSSQGGALGMVNSNNLIAISNLVYGNTSGSGAAFDVRPPSQSVGEFTGIFVNNTIVGNKTETPVADGAAGESAQLVLEGNLAQWILVNNIVVGSASTPALGCGKPYNYLSTTPLILDHNLIWNTDNSPAYTGVCTNQTGVYGNIAADPHFVDAAGQDYHLKLDSPAIDAGNDSAPSLQPVDLEGAPRQADYHGNGYPVVDLGAYEVPAGGAALPNGTAIALTAPPYVINGGAQLTLQATVSSTLGVPTGSLTYFMDGQQLGVSLIDGTGNSTFQTQGLTPGLHAFVAQYAGQGVFSRSISVKRYVLVQKYPVELTLSSSLNPSLPTDTVVLTVQMQTGSLPAAAVVQIAYGSSSASVTADSSGKGTYTLPALAPGSYYISATYNGDETHQAATGSVYQTVKDPKAVSLVLRSSANPAVRGANVTFTATLTSTTANPTGTILFTDSVSGATFVAPVTNPTWTVSNLAVGFHQISALYQGDASHNTATDTLYQQILDGLATSTSLTSSRNPAPSGSNITFTARVTTSAAGTPSGSVTFTDGLSPLGSASLTAGVATITTSSLGRGQHSIHAAYSGDATFGASEGTLSQVISGASSSTVLTATPTTAYAFTAVAVKAVTSIQGGGASVGAALHILDNGTQIPNLSIASDGSVSGAVQLAVGTHSLTAVYDGDAVADGSTSTVVTVRINPNSATTALTLSTHATTSFQPVTATATVSSSTTTHIPNGTVTFLATPLLTAQVSPSGIATASIGLGAGTYQVKADYLPADGNFISFASTPQTLVISKGPTTTAVTSLTPSTYQFRPVTITGAVNDNTGRHLATGTMTLLVDGVPAATAPLAADDSISFTLSNVTPGNHTVVLSYSGDANFLPSASAGGTFTILPSDFTLTVPGTVTIPTEHHHTTAVELASLGDFSGPVSLACGNLPAHATCTWAQSSLNLAKGAKASTTVVLDTSDVPEFKPEAVLHVPMDSNRFTLAVLIASPLLLLLGRKRLPVGSLLALLAMAITAATITGCSTKYPEHTAPGTYNITITAAGGTAQHTQTIKLIVTQ